MDRPSAGTDQAVVRRQEHSARAKAICSHEEKALTDPDDHQIPSLVSLTRKYGFTVIGRQLPNDALARGIGIGGVAPQMYCESLGRRTATLRATIAETVLLGLEMGWTTRLGRGELWRVLRGCSCMNHFQQSGRLSRNPSPAVSPLHTIVIPVCRPLIYNLHLNASNIDGMLHLQS